MIVVWWLLFAILFAFLMTVFFGAPYVPSLDQRVRLAFDELYRVGETDFLVDIGSGDGRILREARRRGARALGYEINPFLVLISQLLSMRDHQINTKWGDYRTQKLPEEATVVYVFGVSRNIEKIITWVDGQARAQDRRIYVLSFGFQSKNFTALRNNETHFLYEVGALQGTGISV